MTTLVRTLTGLAASAALLAGCGPSATHHPSSLAGSFVQIEGAVADLGSTILDPKYKGIRDLGSDGDRIGLALMTFKGAVGDGPLQAEADAIQAKVNALETLAAKRAPVDQQRAAVKDLQAKVAEVKAKL